MNDSFGEQVVDICSKHSYKHRKSMLIVAFNVHIWVYAKYYYPKP